ncbi:enoyl-CoA hydratase-related protein [Heyndrickxia oleronia]|jgi:2-(1,2-epoxy-1,2-dihydrophenyl)acetyl-CoA isomerase|uniref:enoyl-CoA hydratase-related protein n=1 Tax=Heyndrickxia oleronia TaxID=38875 RepID=UPI00242EB493|nr:enoyl-CoA hydratase-related protein [Heyndrickxia oleronia]MCI1591969.1 enoyl-CoA hydratase-related protein [Heyndrickxia oleronia]MCI1613911.1 enoyl-CoA hydratase-related protein [Heyndrickxia oleronia]MCI1745146.1 enoyl-CoA hydratase-related protein [Heyndrickxia oleronia]MCI1760883.1 enoyl-CoA hydratase-related protein [Heyndrickxia oleronia]
MYETIEFEVRNHVAWVTLNRPEKLNAFNEQMKIEIKESLKKAAADTDVRCIVITGNGRAFCSGQDLQSVNEDTDYGEHLRKYYNPMIQQMAAIEKPIIAAINGTAAGAGLSLALACDFRLAHEKSSFIEAFIHVGLVPDSGNMYYLPRIVGHAKALELAILGEKISAAEAKDIGLVTQVIPHDKWNEDVTAFAEKLAHMPTKAIGLIKRYFNQSWDSNLQEVLGKEAYAQKIAGSSYDHREGIAAFLEKRKPLFLGK